MGRYAFFNTGFEYEFAYSIQESEDILMFDGEYYEKDNMVYWKNEDLLSILDELEHFPFNLPDFTNFDQNLSGTYKLKYMLEEIHKNKKIDFKLFYTFLLGCIIYHQLLYRPNLSVYFEY